VIEAINPPKACHSFNGNDQIDCTLISSAAHMRVKCWQLVPFCCQSDCRFALRVVDIVFDQKTDQLNKALKETISNSLPTASACKTASFPIELAETQRPESP